jgi:hypothetical protein
LGVVASRLALTESTTRKIESTKEKKKKKKKKTASKAKDFK